MSDLIKVEFTPLINRYETTAIFKDNQGQEFLIKISGYNKETIEKIIETWYISFDTQVLLSQKSKDKNKTLLQNNNFELDKHQNLEGVEDNTNVSSNNNEIDIVFQNINNKFPYNFQFKLSNDIQQNLSDGEQIAFKINPSNPDIIFRNLGIVVTANILVSKNGANFTMLAAQSKNAPDNAWIPVDGPKFISVSNGQPGRGSLQYTVGDKNKWFKINVEGQRGTNYEIDGSWKIR
ncbi:MAG: hypothetical protein RMZ43_018875 [Nostoc sp. CmiVER01]|uniref:hypothetical protein n=1 Tax=Nostoc sp. CmiVER01 TaxID=3075384 RepID=UPI002AD58164|nr:hypothetical protein [Nostoc sp. CmiVER01]MDZ8126766.1 hypothetical protein [Nostoc sp. CmiVER01]